MGVLLKSLSVKLCCLQVVFILAFLDLANAFVEEGSNLPPDDYTPFPDVDMAYKVHNERKTWSEAKQICLEEGAHLAIIDSMTKVRHVAPMKGFNTYVWVGMYRPNNSSPWVTASMNSPKPNLPWAPGKPHGSQNCLTIRGCNRGLSNEDCSSSKKFVCEMPLTREYANIMIN